jgi:hypothetical protein
MNSKAKIYTGTIMRKDFDTGVWKHLILVNYYKEFRSWNNWIVKLKLFHLKNQLIPQTWIREWARI